MMEASSVLRDAAQLRDAGQAQLIFQLPIYSSMDLIWEDTYCAHGTNFSKFAATVVGWHRRRQASYCSNVKSCASISAHAASIDLTRMRISMHQKSSILSNPFIMKGTSSASALSLLNHRQLVLLRAIALTQRKFTALNFLFSRRLPVLC